MACSESALKVGCRYRHYLNGRVYLLICIAVNSNTDVRYVVYREFDNAERPLYLRPFDEFCKKFTFESGFWTDPHKAEGYDPYNSAGV